MEAAKLKGESITDRAIDLVPRNGYVSDVYKQKQTVRWKLSTFK